jgi:sortase A
MRPVGDRRATAVAVPPRRLGTVEPASRRIVRGVGWALIGAGAVVLLYVAYLLWFTGLQTATAQRDLADRFETITEGRGAPTAEPPAAGRSSEAAGDAFAALWFERDRERVVTDDVLYVVEGTSVEDLKRGPGYYVGSALPGQSGNFAIAGHRTTYGAPFWSLNALAEGDTIHVVDRNGTEWRYAFREQRIVEPTDVWVVSDADPIGLGAPTITLTTCHPRASAAQRLVVFGELVGSV